MEITATMNGTLTFPAGTNVTYQFDMPAGVGSLLPDPIISWIVPVDPAANTRFWYQRDGYGQPHPSVEETYLGINHFTVSYTATEDTQVQFRFFWTNEDPYPFYGYYETS